MSLRINNLVGFGGGNLQRIITLNVSASENDYVLYSKLDAAGHSPASVTPAGTIIKVVLSNGVIIGASSISNAGYRTKTGGQTYGAGWSTADNQLIVEGTNTATVQGAGGVGGTGRIEDAGGHVGLIQVGGPGGGGAGTVVGVKGSPTYLGTNAANGTQSAGGAGGAGDQGLAPDFAAATSGGAGGVALEASSGGPNITLRPATSATLRAWGGGAGGGGGGGTGDPVGTGGAGGGPGLDGAAGTLTAAGAGGSNGNAYSTPGAATITEIGPGTIDTRGT